MRHLMRTAAVLLGTALAASASAQDAPPPAPPAPPAAPAAKKPPKEPPKAAETRILEALREVFGGGAAAVAARASLEGAIAEWGAEAKEDPLRAVKWWKGALASALSNPIKKTGIFEEKVPLAEGKEAHLWVSVPKSHGPKAACPAILSILAADQDPKKALPALYGDLLKEWIVVAVVADPKAAGFDVVKEPWTAALGLRWAVEHLRVDRDRVVLDAAPAQANLALSLGAEWAVHFAGVVLRGPSATTPLASNLGLCGVALVEPAASSEAHAKAAEAVKAAVPAAAAVPAGDAGAAALHQWMADLPPRRISQPGPEGYSWRTRPQGGEPWGYWLWVFRAADSKKDHLVAVKVKRDVEKGVVDIESDNLAEGVLLLNDEVVDLDREVTVRVNGKEIWKGKPERSVKTALYWIGQTGERTLFVPAEVRFTVEEVSVAPKKAAGPAPAPGAAGKGGAPAAPADAPPPK